MTLIKYQKFGGLPEGVPISIPFGLSVPVLVRPEIGGPTLGGPAGWSKLQEQQVEIL